MLDKKRNLYINLVLVSISTEYKMNFDFFFLFSSLQTSCNPSC